MPKVKSNKKIATINNKSLFWDVDVSQLDPERHADFIIIRVLDRGRPEDFDWILKKYGEEKIKNALKRKFYQLSKKSAQFWLKRFKLRSRTSLD